MNCNFNKPMTQGTVLITVLLVVAFIAILLLEISKTVNYQANLNRNLMQRDQAYEYLIGMEELAKLYLKQAFSNEKDENVNLGQPWAKKNIQYPIDGGSMSAVIHDMQSCFNLNSIANLNTDETSPNNAGNSNLPAANSNGKVVQANNATRGNGQNRVTIGEEILTILLEKTLDNLQLQPAAMAAAVKDWIDSDSTPSGPDGAEDSYYQGLRIGYLPPNGPIAHVSELRTVKSFDAISYSLVRPYLCALPDAFTDKINVNTITLDRSHLLFAALDGKLNSERVNKLISERPESGYTLQAFWDKVGANIKIRKQVKARIGVNSRFFQLDAKAEINQTRVYLKTLFTKDEDNNFVVVSRYFGKE